MLEPRAVMSKKRSSRLARGEPPDGGAGAVVASMRAMMPRPPADLGGRGPARGPLMGVVADGGTRIREGDVVLVNFGWSRHLRDGGPGEQWWSSNAPGFTEDLCRELHDLGVRAVGS